jgi:hypothetical protein
MQLVHETEFLKGKITPSGFILALTRSLETELMAACGNSVMQRVHRNELPSEHFIS